jgi:hypothetical protein
LYPTHPLPFVNAARTYQQLNQRGLSTAHVQRAVALDPSFPLPHVDLAQALLYQGKVEACQKSLLKALALARHGGSLSLFLSLSLSFWLPLPFAQCLTLSPLSSSPPLQWVTSRTW